MKQYKYPQLTGKCEKCIGCNRLELDNFKGILRCENYIEKEQIKDEKDK